MLENSIGLHLSIIYMDCCCLVSFCFALSLYPVIVAHAIPIQYIQNTNTNTKYESYILKIKMFCHIIGQNSKEISVQLINKSFLENV